MKPTPVPTIVQPDLRLMLGSQPPHYHDLDSSCLVAIPAVPLALGRLPEPDEPHAIPPVAVSPGWYRCQKFDAYYVHDHAGHFVSHPPQAKNVGCPAPAAT
jgi:hypothetical protein